jgi:hypothetical protein
MAVGFIGFHHIPGACNPADVLTKHWLYACVWNMLQPLLLWQCDGWTVIQLDLLIRLKQTDVTPFMLLGSDKTTWKIQVLVQPDGLELPLLQKLWLEFGCLCEQHSQPLV